MTSVVQQCVLLWHSQHQAASLAICSAGAMFRFRRVSSIGTTGALVALLQAQVESEEQLLWSERPLSLS